MGKHAPDGAGTDGRPLDERHLFEGPERRRGRHDSGSVFARPLDLYDLAALDPSHP